MHSKMGFLKIPRYNFLFLLACFNLTVWMALHYSAMIPKGGTYPEITSISTRGFKRNMRSTPGFNWRERPVVMLTSYMHGGSSIFGKIFQMNPDTTYFYEPLDAIYSSVFGTHPVLWPSTYLNWPNGTYRHMGLNVTRMVEYYIKSLIDCKVQQLPPSMTIDITFGGQHTCHASCGDKSHNYRFFDETFLVNSTYRHIPCKSPVTFNSDMCSFEYLESKCRNSKMVALKMLRYDPADFGRSFAKSENTYLIHHIRDPRGIIQSFIKDGNVATEEAITHLARNLCSVMRHNLDHVTRLLSESPHRVMVVRHEDFAEDPQGTAKKLYRFTGRENLPENVSRFLHEHTHGKKDRGKYMRRNSSQTAWRWKKTMLERHEVIVKEVCLLVWNQLKVFGYEV